MWLGGLLLVLGGLFGMHGLADHGTDAGMESAMRATVGVAGVTDAGSDAERVGLAAVPRAATAAVGATGGSAMDMGAMGMCVAVLGLGLIAWLLRSWGLRRRPLRWLGSRPARAPGSRDRRPDPPSLIQLSIQRC